MFSTVSTAWPRPSGPVRKPEIERPGTERRVVDLGAVKRLQPIAGGIAKRNQAANAPGIGQCLRLGRDLRLRPFPAGPRAHPARRASATSQPKKRAPSPHRAIDDDALLAVVHPECQQRIAALHRLQADQAGAELPPILEASDPNPAYPRPCNAIAVPPPPVILAVFTRPLLGQILRVFSAFQTKDGRREPAPGPRASLDISARRMVFNPHEHRRPPIPSLVAHLLIGGRCDFIFPNRRRPPSQCDGGLSISLRLSCVAFPPQVS